MERLEQDASGRTSERRYPPDELVDQLVGQLPHEMALPVMPVDAVTGAEQGLLRDERMPAYPVLHEPRYPAQAPEQWMIVLRAGDARENDDGWLERLVQDEHRLAARVALRVGDDIPESAKHVPDRPAVGELPADHRLQRVQSKLEVRRDAEVAASSP